MDIIRMNLILGRISKGLSQKQVAEMAKMSPMKIFRIEKDPSNLRVDDLVEISKVLGLNAGDVITKDIFNVTVRMESKIVF